MTTDTPSQAISWARSNAGEPLRAEAIAMAMPRPITANLEALRRTLLVPATARGVNAKAHDDKATHHDGDDAVSEETRAART
ncbi:MAG: hypothetical protein AMJ62_12880 [Myxococcales bacterium SG8_38]|nr:MAG: hypothetical protein AMJ62_12880 [Myxococcales bacterium SG8_38]